ncbi:hypothetical protein PO909_029609 [Leuciscus waleckii]
MAPINRTSSFLEGIVPCQTDEASSKLLHLLWPREVNYSVQDCQHFLSHIMHNPAYCGCGHCKCL